jgi:hypothetical protein
MGVIIIYLLSIFSLAFLIKESDGPFALISKLRNILMRNKYAGVFFYKLLECWYCVGCHTGYIIYLLFTPYREYSFSNFIIWSLAGGAICLIVGLLLERLSAGVE